MDANIFHRVVNSDTEANRQHDWIRVVKAAEIKSMLPALIDNEIKTSWVHESSMQLGGDAFDYWWVDDNHFAVYLLDVCGHGVGVGPALLSIAVANVMRSRALPNTDFSDPIQVLKGLNHAFPMEEHKGMFFTIWYGVYNKTTRQLVYASGGHPPAVLITESLKGTNILQLKTPGFVIGGMAETQFFSASCYVEKFSKLYLFSDGVYEINKPNGTMLELSEFVKILAQPSLPGISDVARIRHFAQELNGTGPFADDFSLIQILFT